MRTKLQIEADIKNFNGAAFFDHKVMAELLLDVREQLVEINSRQSSARVAKQPDVSGKNDETK